MFPKALPLRCGNLRKRRNQMEPGPWLLLSPLTRQWDLRGLWRPVLQEAKGTPREQFSPRNQGSPGVHLISLSPIQKCCPTRPSVVLDREHLDLPGEGRTARHCDDAQEARTARSWALGCPHDGRLDDYRRVQLLIVVTCSTVEDENDLSSGVEAHRARGTAWWRTVERGRHGRHGPCGGVRLSW